MNRHCHRSPREIFPLARRVGNDRVRGAEYHRPVKPVDASWLDRSPFAEADQIDVLKLMAAGLAHDINNMLHVSIGAIELLQYRIDGVQTEEMADLSKIALMSLKRASAMAYDFLSVTQPVPIDSKVICVSETIASMAPLLKWMLGDEIEIQFSLTEGLSRISCNRQRLESAILNLAINARDAMPAGGTVAITTFHAESAEKSPGPAPREGIGIRVIDTGEGMPSDVLQRAFDPFYTTKSHGTGLGLAMIKDFVERCRGNVSATSIAGCGTTIELRFPVA
jgi:signal transduction histidine kinase